VLALSLSLISGWVYGDYYDWCVVRHPKWDECIRISSLVRDYQNLQREHQNLNKDYQDLMQKTLNRISLMEKEITVDNEDRNQRIAAEEKTRKQNDDNYEVEITRLRNIIGTYEERLVQLEGKLDELRQLYEIRSEGGEESCA
jgi:hypothetical protein